MSDSGPFLLPMTERLQRIAEREIPITEKDCRVKRMHKMDNRKILIAAMLRKLHGLSDEQKENMVKQWEDASEKTN